MKKTAEIKQLKQKAVDMRRDIQKETSIYAKTHKYDLMQEQAIRNTETMMRWCEGYYYFEWQEKRIQTGIFQPG